MGACEGSSLCIGGSKESELDIEKAAYEHAIREKAHNLQSSDDLEEDFLAALKVVSYPDPKIKVDLNLYIFSVDLRIFLLSNMTV